MSAYVLTCDEANVVPAAATSAGLVGSSCTAPYYAPAPSLVPALSAGQGASLGMAIVAVWACAWAWRVLHRVS